MRFNLDVECTKATLKATKKKIQVAGWSRHFEDNGNDDEARI